MLTGKINQQTFTCSNLTRETLGQSVKYVQSWQQKHQKEVTDVVLVSLFLTLNRFHTLLWCYHCWLWTNKCQLGILLSLIKVKLKSESRAKNSFSKSGFNLYSFFYSWLKYIHSKLDNYIIDKHFCFDDKYADFNETFSIAPYH